MLRLLAALSLLAACAPEPGPIDPPARRTQPDAPATVTLGRESMSTPWRITILTTEARRQDASAIAGASLDEVDRLEGLLSEWRATSEVTRVNEAAGRAAVKVSEETYRCLEVALATARWSGGAYDVSWAALRDLWDFGATSAHVPPSRASVAARLPLWSFRRIHLDPGTRSVFLERAGMAIGLGGIAKGFALDRIAARLHAADFDDFLIFGGGQIRVGGRRGDRPWRVGIQHPRDPASTFAFVEVEGDASVSTSGDYEHAWFHGGRRYHHVLDPETGFPSERSASVTVISPSALWADAVDTAVFVLGPERGLAALADAPGGPHQALVIDPELRVTTTPGLRDRLRMQVELVDERLAPGPLSSRDRGSRASADRAGSPARRRASRPR